MGAHDYILDDKNTSAMQDIFKVKGQKRARDEDQGVRRFLSLEAEVSDMSEDNDDDDSELDDFLEDGEPIAANRSVSHRLLFQEHARAQAEGEWDALLTRARERGQPIHNCKDDSPHMDCSLPFTGDVRLWRVAVKPGWEETAAFVLMEKIIRSGRRGAVAAIIGRVSRPGWIVIEAAEATDVQALCQGALNVFSQRIHIIEPEDAAAWLREQNSFIPRPNSWVRLTKHPYRGDLAYVTENNDTKIGASLLVVPRLNLQRRMSGQHQKRQRGLRHRPEQALFDANKAREIWGERSVRKQNQTHFFKGKGYKDGYLCLDTDEFYTEEATPTPEEMALFKYAKAISRDTFQHTLEIMDAQRLCIGDRVKVVEGEAQGTVGVVDNIIGGEAALRILPGNLELALPVAALRKSLELGDEVVVVVGPETGITGWVVSVVGERLVIYNHKTAQELETSSHCVNFWGAPFEFGHSLPHVGLESQGDIDSHREREGFATLAELESRGPLPAGVLQEEIEKLRSDPNRHLVGRDVRVIGKHRYNDFVGTIKATEDHDHVIVEFKFSDGMIKERLHLSNLALFNDPEKKTLGHDPNRKLIGRHVRVIKHRLKDYEGIIKSTQQDNHVLVEIQATMQQELLPLANLALWDDPEKNLLGKLPPETVSTASSSSKTMEIPESTLPLVPSTPLPPSSSVWLSPAWNPSSRTPNSHSPHAQNPWMEHPSLAGKRVKLQIRDTIPVLRDPGWKNGDFEDRFGLWLGTEGTNVKVILGLHNTVLIPEKYVRTLRPSVQGQQVVVLSGDLIGQDFHVVTAGEVNCLVGCRRNGKLDPKSKLCLATSSLAVIANP